VWLGGYPGALRELLGLRIEEFAPLLDEESAELDNGTTGTLWTDRIDLTSPATEVLASYKTGEMAGRPAVTWHPAGSGSAGYVSTRLGPAGIAAVLGEFLDRAGVRSELPPDLRGRVELTVRDGIRFLINRTDAPVDLTSLGVDVPVLAARAVAAIRA
jgi:beta-galactosidase